MPLSGGADLIRPTLGDRRKELEELRPEVLDLAAEVIALLHAQLHGRATSLHDDRGENYRRQQMRGLHPITVEDLCLLALDAPLAVAQALGPLAVAVGYELAPADTIAPALHEANAGYAEQTGAVVARVSRAFGDGVIDDREDVEIATEIHRAERRLASLKAAVRRQRRAQRGSR